MVARFMRRSRIGVADQGEMRRLKIAPRRRALRLGAAIVFQFEQGKLPCLFGFPCLKLLAAEFRNPLPAKGVAIDNQDVELSHDQPSCARSVSGPGGAGLAKPIPQFQKKLFARAGQHAVRAIKPIEKPILYTVARQVEVHEKAEFVAGASPRKLIAKITFTLIAEGSC